MMDSPQPTAHEDGQICTDDRCGLFLSVPTCPIQSLLIYQYTNTLEKYLTTKSILPDRECAPGQTRLRIEN